MRSNHNKINDIARLDPIDGKLLAESWSRSEAKKALFQELTEAPMVVAAARDGDVLATRPPQHTLRLGAIARRTVAIGVAAAVVLGITTLGTSGPGPGHDKAWGAELVRFAEGSPRLLITQQGWTVARADETGQDEGEMSFVNGQYSMALNWRPSETHAGTVQGYKETLGESWDITVAGHDGVLIQNGFTAPSVNTFNALWLDDQHSLVLRGDGFDNVDEFRAVAATLEIVNVDTWLSAMPRSVIKSRQILANVDEMLHDIPVPDSVDVKELENQGLGDRYSLGARVTGIVACGWIEQWVKATNNGNAQRQQEAVDAMRTSHDWAILHEMERQGGWPDVIWYYADAIAADDYATVMDRGTYDGDSFGYGAGLGCE